MLRTLLRAATSAAASNRNSIFAPALAAAVSSSSQLTSSRTFASKNNKATVTKAKTSKSKPGAKSKPVDASSSSAADEFPEDFDVRSLRLAEDEGNKALDVGPNGRLLFTSTPTLPQLTKKDTCMYMKFSMEELNKMLPEGLPMGMVKEFEESMRSALLIRQSFLDLRDNFRRIVDPPMYSDGKGVAYLLL